MLITMACNLIRIRSSFDSFYFVICFFCLFSTGISNSYGQDSKKLAELNEAFAKATSDTSKIIAMQEIINLYASSQRDTTLALIHTYLSLAEKIKFVKGQAWLLHTEGYFYYNKSDYANALLYFNKSIPLFESIHLSKGISSANNNIALIYYLQGNYPTALQYHFKSLEIREQAKDKLGIAISYGNIGSVYKAQLDYVSALNYYEKALQMSKELEDKKGISRALNNVAIIYLEQGQEVKALKYFQESLQIKENIGDKANIPILLNNIANIYQKQKKYDSAIQYNTKALELNTKLNYKRGIIYSYIGLAKLYLELDQYAQAIEYGEKSLKLAQETKALAEENEAAMVLYHTYKADKQLEKALQYHELYKSTNDTLFNLEKSKSISNLESKIGLEKKERELILLAKDNALTKLDAEKKERELEIIKKQAETEQLFALARSEKDKRKADSLYAEANKARLETEHLKITQEKITLENEKQQLAQQAELEQQKRIRNTSFGISITFFIVLILVFIGYQQKQKINKLLAKQNQEITEQQYQIASKNKELSQANEELFQQQEELVVLNESLEVQKKEVENTYTKLKITSDMLGKSIGYASDIQSIILADNKELLRFFTDLFVIYRPKDTVSGDFYWFTQIQEQKAIFVLADCTGHGVPGAFMSMLGSTLLDEIINEKKQELPAQILSLLHQRLRKILKQEDARNSDGMDIAICSFEKQAQQQIQITFAGAKTSMYYTENDQLQILVGDKVYLGGRHATVNFTDKTTIVALGTQFYFASDGFADQNNVTRARFGVKPLQEMLLANKDLPMEEQKTKLLEALEKHQGEETQRDDISLIGLKI